MVTIRYTHTQRQKYTRMCTYIRSRTYTLTHRDVEQADVSSTAGAG